jgi:large subunit ribosomal protein L3
MIRAIIGRKLGMTQIFGEDGSVVPVTVVLAGPCTVTQVKTPERDGYAALQLGFGTKKAKHVNKPAKGHLAKVQKVREGYFAVLKEIRMDGVEEFSLGQEVTADIFEIGERVDVIGMSKGKGFAGTIKRWGFHRGPVTHGCKNIREPGSTGCATFPGRVLKGKRMAGQLGHQQVTTMNLKVVDVLADRNLLLLRGAVPGARNGVIYIRKTNRVR